MCTFTRSALPGKESGIEDFGEMSAGDDFRRWLHAGEAADDAAKESDPVCRQRAFAKLINDAQRSA